MSIRKLMLPPVVSSGQYQMIESKIAMVEHIAMTDSAIIGPQWHNLRTSWRFSNVTKADKKFMFRPQVLLIFRQNGSWNVEVKFNVSLLASAILQSHYKRLRTYSFLFSKDPGAGLALGHWGFLLSIFPCTGNKWHPTLPAFCTILRIILVTLSNPPSRRHKETVQCYPKTNTYKLHLLHSVLLLHNCDFLGCCYDVGRNDIAPSNRHCNFQCFCVNADIYEQGFM